MMTRRDFLRRIITTSTLLPFALGSFPRKSSPYERISNHSCNLYRALNGKPEINLSKVIEMMGGIESIIGPYDIVVIKPNVQWWNQGAPNLSSLKAFVDLIMNRSGGFNGEVIFGENCHRGASPWMSINSGWKRPFSRNSDLNRISNFNELSTHLKREYGNRFSTYHWIDVAAGNKRVFGPADGAGYVYCDGSGGVPLLCLNNGLPGNKYRAVIMTYPIFETDRGTLIDFKNGIWERGEYSEQPLRFINFEALNHHSIYCGATSAIKNYLGVADLSGGPDPHNAGRLTEDYYNFHSFPFDKWSTGPESGMLGAEIGVFMKKIRKADLNITTAEWVGLASRTEAPVARTRAVMACVDAVALDYHATKYVLFPNSRIAIHNPDNKTGPLHEYLFKCVQRGEGILDESNVAVKSYDFKTRKMQKDSEFVIIGEREWGSSIKSILKYLFLRFF